MINCKWVFRTKRDEHGNEIAQRSRLVARGDTQVDGVDYQADDTFAPVAKMTSIRSILALAAKENYEIHQIDVKSAYLYGRLEDNEVIYMKPPRGVELSGIKSGQVLKLRACLYGLKQAGRRWAKTLRSHMEQIGLRRSEHDHAVYYRHLPNGEVIVIFVHVDDMSLTTRDSNQMALLKQKISDRFEIVDSGDIKWMLGIELIRDRTLRTVSLSQSTYVDQILERYGFADIKPLALPVDPNVILSKDQCPTTPPEIASMRDKPYREALGALMYISVASRPDITYAVAQLAKFGENPGPTHWTALKRVYAYLKKTRSLRLTLGGSDDTHLLGYSDADGMSNEDRHAISGYVFLIGGAVSWSSKRQEIVSLSTVEAEYVALTHATKEAIWLRNFLTEVYRAPLDPVTLYGDNQGALALAHDDKFHARTKHIDIRFHFVRYAVETNKIKLVYCPTEDMTADVLTKALPSMKAKHFASSMGLAQA